MLTTEKICDDPIVVLQRIHAFTDVERTRRDAEDGVAMIAETAKKYGPVRLLLDCSDPVKEENYSIAAHGAWAKGFKESELVKAHVCKTAVVGIDSPQFRAEKEFMEDVDRKWFTVYDEALGWLKTVE